MILQINNKITDKPFLGIRYEDECTTMKVVTPLVAMCTGKIKEGDLQGACINVRREGEAGLIRTVVLTKDASNPKTVAITDKGFCRDAHVLYANGTRESDGDGTRYEIDVYVK